MGIIVGERSKQWGERRSRWAPEDKMGPRAIDGRLIGLHFAEYRNAVSDIHCLLGAQRRVRPANKGLGA